MNNLKIPKISTSQLLNSNYKYDSEFPWIKDFDKWRDCINSDQSLIKCGMQIADPKLGDLETLKEFQELANKQRIHLPLILDPNRHFGYDVMSNNKCGKECVDITYYIPNKPPYVPIELKCLVNFLESTCFNTEYIYFKTEVYTARSRQILRNLTKFRPNYDRMMSSLRLESVENVALSVLLFLDMLCQVILQNIYSSPITASEKSHQTLAQLASQDTASFVMIHLLHLLEFSKDPLYSLVIISKVFAPILLMDSSQRRRINEEQDNEEFSNQIEATENKIEECFQHLMLECGYNFWYGRSDQPAKLLNLFDGITPRESQFFLQSSKRKSRQNFTKY